MMKILFSIFIMVGLLVLFGNIGQADLNEGLILYFTFDAGTGEKVTDTSGNGNDGEIQGGAKGAPGKFEQGLKLDGQTQFVLIQHNEIMDATEAVTMACWVNPAKPAVPIWLYYLISKWNYHAGNGRCYLIGLLEAGGMTFFISNDGTDGGASRLDGGTIEYGTDKWQHVAGTYDGTEMKIYINGEDVGKLATKKTIFANEEGMSIGAGSFGKEAAARFTGIIDEVAVYNRALSGDELKRLMEMPPWFAVEPVSQLATTWGNLKFNF